MVFPLVPSPLGGNLGAFTASVFKLDPTGTVPLEPILDLVPGFSPLRVTFDMVDSESISYEYEVTEHAIQDFLDISSNIRKRLEQVTITGTMGATPPFVLGSVITPPVVGSFQRLDLIRARNLKALADARAPVMLVTPRVGLAKCIITSIQQNWTPAAAESTSMTLTFREARLVSPLTGDLLAPDFPSQTPGNNAAEGGGVGTTATATESATASTTTGVPPTVGVAA